MGPHCPPHTFESAESVSAFPAPIDSSIEMSLDGTHVRHLRGVPEILAHKHLLEDFAAKIGQHTSMHGLGFRLEHDYARNKVPHLISVVAGLDVSAPLTLDSLLGCVLFFEYRLWSWNTGFFATGDSSGISSVIAPPGIRAQVAARAASTILRKGKIALACFRSDSGSLDGIAFPAEQQGLWAAQVRGVQDHLHLGPTYDRTLERLGKRTRTHLRYYRKRVEANTGCLFIADAAPYISKSQLASINLTSLKPISQSILDLQFHAAAERPGGFLCGLRARDGGWLSLAGGWRQNHTSLVQWQMNASKLQHLSLCTAFRAYLIEHEVSLGTTTLRFHGGTTHSMVHSFRQEYAVDLLLRRTGPFLAFLVRLVPRLVEMHGGRAGRGNFLVDALRSNKLEWSLLCPPGRQADLCPGYFERDVQEIIERKGAKFCKYYCALCGRTVEPVNKDGGWMPQNHAPLEAPNESQRGGM